MKLYNSMPGTTDLFVQNKSSMQTYEIEPYKSLTKVVSGVKTNKAPLLSEDIVQCLVAPVKFATVTTTGRQEIKDFTFQVGLQIGMELEMAGNRLICSKVLEDCQASVHSRALDGAEVIAVNNRRVLTIAEFREQMSLAQEGTHIVLKVAAFRGGRGKIDDLYNRDIDKNVKVKSLLSTMLMNGLDQDHQHGISNGDLGSGFDESSLDDETLDSMSIISDVKGPPMPGTTKPSQFAGDGEETSSQPASPTNNHGPHIIIPRTSFISYVDPDNADNMSGRSRTLSRGGNRVRLLSQGGDGGDSSPRSVGSPRSGTPRSGTSEKKYRHDEIAKLAARNYADREEDEEKGMMADKHVSAIQALIPSPPHTPGTPKPSSAPVPAVWEPITAVPEQEYAVFPFSSLVCISDHLRFSSCWGDPRKRLQISNYSLGWNVEVNWIDEDCALVPRTDIKGGATHYELLSTDHVWALIATVNVEKSTKHKYHAITGEIETENVDSAASLRHPPVVLLIRASHSSLQEGRCMSVTWSPYSSISVTQRVYAKEKSNNNAANNIHDKHGLFQQSSTTSGGVGNIEGSGSRQSERGGGRGSGSLLPCIHVQIFDGLPQTTMSDSNNRNTTSEDPHGESKMTDTDKPRVRLPDWRKMARQSKKHAENKNNMM
eukprot:gene25933-32443_t